MADKEKAIAKADNRAIATASRRLLEQLGSSGKTEPLRPQMLKGFMARVGGMEKFGDIVASQFMKCSQIDPSTGMEDQSWEWKPQIAAKFAELALRAAGQEDDKQAFDPASLTDEDLQVALKGLMVDQVNTNPAFVQALLNVVKDNNPRLLHDAVDPAPIEAESVEQVKPKVDLSELGLDEKDAGEHE
jgi:hypothetical protein